MRDFDAGFDFAPVHTSLQAVHNRSSVGRSRSEQDCQMLLLSESLSASLPPGPVFPKIYPEIGQDVLTESVNFTEGQPFELFARLRAEAPVSWQREINNGPGFWALTRYDDVMRVDGDPKTFSSQKGGILMAYGPPE